MLSPDGVMARSVKYILTLTFILSVISAAALTTKNNDFSMAEISIPTIETAALDEATARFTIEAALKNSDIDFSEITVCTNKTESGSISINKVIICSRYPKEKIMSALVGLTENIEVVVEND